MKLTLRSMVKKIAPQVNLRPTGVWDFLEHPGHDADGSAQAADFERLWALAEREAYIAGELVGANVTAQ